MKPKIKERFERAGIVTCELRLPGCTPGLYLTFAHSLKRRHITILDEMEEVILACSKCHWEIEKLGEESMTERVKQVIEDRTVLV